MERTQKAETTRRPGWRVLALIGVIVLAVGIFLVSQAQPETACAQGGQCPPGQSWNCTIAGGRSVCSCRASGETPTPQPTLPPPTPATPPPTPNATQAVATATAAAAATATASVPTPTPTPIPGQVLTCVFSNQPVGGVHCPSKYYRVLTLYAHNLTWVLDAECMDESACVPPTPEPPPNVVEPPCPVTPIGGGMGVWCGNYQIDVDAVVPPHLVVRNPWPRGLVTVPNQFSILPDPQYSEPGGAGGEWSEKGAEHDTGRDGSHENQIANYQMGLRWRRIDELPVWTFDERPWNIGRDYGNGTCSNSAQGVDVSHAYETASSDISNPGSGGDADDKPRNGPSLTGEWNLPAYQVVVGTHWALDWAQQWDQWEKVGTIDRCCHVDGGCKDKDYDGCKFDWDGWSTHSEDVYEWVHHFDGWYTVDLTNWGEPNWYYTSYSVRSSGDGVNWGPVLDVVPVPVIEVQSVIQDGD
jgi:hypothetical protein